MKSTILRLLRKIKNYLLLRKPRSLANNGGRHQNHTELHCHQQWPKMQKIKQVENIETKISSIQLTITIMISLETQLEKIETEISSIQFMLFTTKGVTASSDQISGAPLIMMTGIAIMTMLRIFMMMMIHILNANSIYCFHKPKQCLTLE